MNTKINKELLVKKEENTNSSLINRNKSKNSINNAYELDLFEGTEAYYSERYGWTLRKKIV